jgi:hypothetical protein
MVGGIALGGGMFLRTTIESLESVSSPSVAQSIVWAALTAARRTEVPEDIGPFREFVEGPLRQEVHRQLGAEALSHVLERLGHVLWMASSDVQARSVARGWLKLDPAPALAAPAPSAAAAPTPVAPSPAAADTTEGETPEGESGEFPISHVPFVASEPRKRPTDARLEAGSAPSRPEVPIPPPRSSHPLAAPRPPRSGAVTLGKLSVSLARVAARPLPSAVLVLSLDAKLASQTTAEIAGRCSVVRIATPADLARAASTAGERVVVLVDTALPSIDLKTFVGLCPILPASTRVILWGADERQRTRLVATFPIAAGWIASGESTAPGELALAQV